MVSLAGMVFSFTPIVALILTLVILVHLVTVAFIVDAELKANGCPKALSQLYAGITAAFFLFPRLFKLTRAKNYAARLATMLYAFISKKR